MTPEAFAREEQAFRQQVTALNAHTQAIKQALDRMYLDARREIEQATGQIIASIARERGISLVLNAGNRGVPVIYFVSEIDITAGVLSQLDATLADIRLPDMPELPELPALDS